MTPTQVVELEAACGRAGIVVWGEGLQQDRVIVPFDAKGSDLANAQAIRLLQERIERSGLEVRVERWTNEDGSFCKLHLSGGAWCEVNGPQRELLATVDAFLKVFGANHE